jgi:hypothetical protein
MHCAEQRVMTPDKTLKGGIAARTNTETAAKKIKHFNLKPKTTAPIRGGYRIRTDDP